MFVAIMMAEDSGDPKEMVDSASYTDQLEVELASWCIENEAIRWEKVQRERMRHPKLIRDLLLDKLDTHRMNVLDVGSGPVPLSDLLECQNRDVIDPLSDGYRRFFPCPDHIAMKVEDLIIRPPPYDLVICTNALDHVEDPEIAVERIVDVLKPGGYFAVMCAENNAITNPHPAHIHNLTVEQLHRWLDPEFETVWELTFRDHGYRYGWVLHEGKRGQPAFALLMRKCSGYARREPGHSHRRAGVEYRRQLSGDVARDGAGR